MKRTHIFSYILNQKICISDQKHVKQRCQQAPQILLVKGSFPRWRISNIFFF